MSCKRQKQITPANCSEAQLLKMHRDHTVLGDFTLMTDSYHLWISEQKIGESPKQHIEMTRAQFNRLLRWYLRPTKERV